MCRQAQVYPREFCRMICEGVSAQRRMDAINLVAVGMLDAEDLMHIGHEDLHDDHAADMNYEAYDDVSNEPLLPSLVRKARVEEIEYFKSMKVYEYATIDEC